MIRTKMLFGCLKVCAVLFLLQAAMPRPSAQDETSRFHVNVVLVQLNVAVTDNKGNYITGLHPEDFVVTEDSIPEKIATFEVGEEFAHKVGTTNPTDPPLTPERRLRRRRLKRVLQRRMLRNPAIRWPVQRFQEWAGPMCLSCSTPATICTGVLYSRRMPSLILFAPCLRPAGLRSTRTAAICRARPRLLLIASV